MDYHQVLLNFFGHPHSVASATTVVYSYFDLAVYAIKDIISFIGTLVIFAGTILGTWRYLPLIFTPNNPKNQSIDLIRLQLGQSVALGLEFIVAADVIETTTAPDYYTVGILVSVVFIRTFLNYFLNREIDNLATLNQTERSDLK